MLKLLFKFAFTSRFNKMKNKNTFIVSAQSCRVQEHQQVKYLQTEVFNVSDWNLGWTFFRKSSLRNVFPGNALHHVFGKESYLCI